MMIFQFKKKNAKFPNAKIINARVDKFYLEIPFKLFECPYMFDFIKRDWRKILANLGFSHFEEHLLLGKYEGL